MDKRRCPYCETYRNNSDILTEDRVNKGVFTRKLICRFCFDRREKNKSQAARDAWGREVSRRNAEAQGRISAARAARAKEQREVKSP